MQRYMHVHCATSEQLAAVPIAFRKHACMNPQALMQTPMTIADHQASRMVADPLHLLDCCLMTDGAVVVFVTTTERARDLKQTPVRVTGMQGIRSGREEFIFAPRGLGLAQQSVGRAPAREVDLQVYRDAGVDRSDVQGLYTYDAFSRSCCSRWSASAFVVPARRPITCRAALLRLGAPCREYVGRAAVRGPMWGGGTRWPRWCGSCGVRPGRRR